MKLPRVLLAAAVSLVAMPSLATAADTAPPGNSAVDQYRESAAPSSSNSKKVPEATRKRLARDGKDGEALANALDNAGGVASSSTQSGAADGTGGDEASGGSTSGRSSEKSRDASDNSNGATATSAKGQGSPTSTTAEAAPKKAEKSSATAASATVGPFPVWSMVVAALVIVGVAAIARRRASA